MGIIGEQFSQPTGLIGALAGRFMAKNNAAFNRWVVAEAAATATPSLATIVEIGSGPGIGTQALLALAPGPVVIAVDPSPPMQRQLRRRNRRALAEGRLRTVTVELSELTDVEPVDLVVAVHVLYFWRDPEQQLARIGDLLLPGGLLALGYQLRQDMPTVAQRDFPTSGHRLYDDDRDVAGLVRSAGLIAQPVRVFGTAERPAGRLLLASRPQ